MSYKSIDSLSENPKEIFTKVTSILLRLTENVLKNPSEPKYRKVRLENQTISTVILPSIGGMECLFDMGFVEADDSLVLPKTVNLDKLRNFQQAIKLKIGHVMNGEKSSTVVSQSTPPPPSTTPTTSTIRQPEKNQVMNSKASTAASQNVGTVRQLEKVQDSSSKEVTSETTKERFFYSMENTSQKVCQYEDKELQLEALSLVPITKLEAETLGQFRAFQRAMKKEDMSCSYEGSAYETIFLKTLMKWFKTEFFKWVNSPPCSSCKSDTVFRNYSTFQDELKETVRVEVYYCNRCNKEELFPRYNNIKLLLKSRRGRCGEWAQCFTFFCRALRWDARFVMDNHDHVWTEVYSSYQDRWLHCDPCECIVDEPLIYEKGWKKPVDYIIAYSCDGVYDVTWRYTTDYKTVNSRRNIMTEVDLMKQMLRLTEMRRQGLSEKRKKYLSKRHVLELVEFLTPTKDIASKSYEGRTSGSLAWRLARGECAFETSTSSFVWEPTPSEVSAKKIIVKYCSSRDEYVNGEGKVVLKSWDQGAFKIENMFRKEELDWKTVYLCRSENSDKGSVTWKFDVESSKLLIDNVEVTFQITTFKTGSIKLTMCDGNENTCVIVNQKNGPFKTFDFKGSTAITLKAELSGGEGDVAWQHVQLFRMPLGDSNSKETYPFCVTINLCERSV